MDFILWALWAWWFSRSSTQPEPRAEQGEQPASQLSEVLLSYTCTQLLRNYTFYLRKHHLPRLKKTKAPCLKFQDERMTFQHQQLNISINSWTLCNPTAVILNQCKHAIDVIKGQDFYIFVTDSYQSQLSVRTTCDHTDWPTHRQHFQTLK